LKLTALRGVKITGSARPGERIELHARILGRMGSLIQAEGSATLNGATVMQAQLTLSGGGGNELRVEGLLL
jgi:3-hydroxymyristoyl/3-hydroxydecanoyl-(acyl carrier protein) dehydratase